MDRLCVATPTVGLRSNASHLFATRRFLTKCLKPARVRARAADESIRLEVDKSAAGPGVKVNKKVEGPGAILPKLSSSSPSGQEGSECFKDPLVGDAKPLGAHAVKKTGAVNFAIATTSATRVALVLFTEADLQKGRSTIEIELNPEANRTGDVWHIALPDLDTSLLYGYRLWGLHQDLEKESVASPMSEEEGDGSRREERLAAAPGHRFDDSHVVIDPYGRSVISRRIFGQLSSRGDDALGSGDNWPQSACMLPSLSEDEFDWEGDTCQGTPLEDLVIYEMHVRGFTQDPSSNVESPGTYEALVQKLDYLQDLGVNCIELLPIHDFNELEYYEVIPETGCSRFNYWGYSTVNFFSPMSRYSAAIARGGNGQELVSELKYLVRESHKRGIEVIMDVVFNHTAEGNHLGPTLSFRGIDNRVYYMLAPGGEYYNYSGCGNTFNCNHPVVRQFIVDCLSYWVEEIHIDGFRFDLASILTRAHSAWYQGEFDSNGIWRPPHSMGGIVDDNGYMSNGVGIPTGTPLADPVVVEMISEEPVLRSAKMIAEAWDADGLNQVGAFPHYGGRWAEWNGHFRDVVRNFIKGTDGPWAGQFASVFCGSPHLYDDGQDDNGAWWKQNEGRKWCGGRGPIHSVNFVTAHDGFTLADLVAYNEKNNLANGEDNRDGEQHNNSWNCGAEGPTTTQSIQTLRARQMCNFMCVLLLSHGVPMLTMGDEYGHTKEGNNNTYCHDSPLNWFNWDKAKDAENGFHRFVRALIGLRKSRSELRKRNYVRGDEIQWHGKQPCTPDWSEKSRLVALTMSSPAGGGLYIAFNTCRAHEPVVLSLPKWEGWLWDEVVDTGAIAPFNFLVEDEQLPAHDLNVAKAEKAPWLDIGAYPMLPYSCIILQAVQEDTSGRTPVVMNVCEAPAQQPPTHDSADASARL